jgi:hypothetical protein
MGTSDKQKRNNTGSSVDAAGSNHILWIITNPFAGSLLQPLL